MMKFLFSLKNKLLGENLNSPNIDNLKGEELVNYCLKNNLIVETTDGITEKDYEAIQKRIWE
jgi:hypothetical protein